MRSGEPERLTLMHHTTIVVTDILEPAAGFEPATVRLQSECSTTELSRHNTLIFYHSFALCGQDI